MKSRFTSVAWFVWSRKRDLEPSTPRRTEALASTGTRSATRAATTRSFRIPLVYRPQEKISFPSFEPRVRVVLGNWGGPVERVDLVHERRELIGQRGILDLEDVLGVLLA